MYTGIGFLNPNKSIMCIYTQKKIFIYFLGKTVAFNLSKDISNPPFEIKQGSSENLRHQVLLNTIQSLKRNLEDHSASLQQTYRSTQNMYKY